MSQISADRKAGVADYISVYFLGTMTHFHMPKYYDPEPYEIFNTVYNSFGKTAKKYYENEEMVLVSDLSNNEYKILKYTDGNVKCGSVFRYIPMSQYKKLTEAK